MNPIDRPVNATASSSPRVLVIGGGFSGMAAAIACAGRGMPVDLVEIDPGWRSYGAGISVGGATLRAFEQLGILGDFMRLGAASDGLDLLAPHGALIAQLPTPRAAGVGPDVPGGGAIMRPVLAKIMAEATRRAGVDVRLGCSVSGMRQDAEGVEAAFTDASTRRYDVVIAADGLYSKTRTQLFPDAPAPVPTGQGVWRAVLPRPADINRVTMWMGGKVKPGANPVSATEMYLFLTETRAADDRVPTEDQPAILRELLAGFPDPRLQRARTQIDAQAQVIYRPLYNLLLPQPWFRGRVVLIGDAVHATTPHLASGACIGIEDGIVIADELSQPGGDVDAALLRFQSRRWERCRMVVETSRRLGEIEVADGDKQEHGRLMQGAHAALAQPI